MIASLNPNELVLLVNYTDENGKKQTYPIQAVDPLNSALHSEYNDRAIADAYTGIFHSPEQEKLAYKTAYNRKGKELYRCQITPSLYSDNRSLASFPELS